MDLRSIGSLVMAVGLAVVVLGLLIRLGALSWFGKLPGDFSYKGEHFAFFFPFLSMLLLSVLLSLVLYVLKRLL